MTDAREILRRYFSGSDYRCDDLMNTLHGYGFRILGPDEIDGPTVEKCAEVAEEMAEWVPLKSGGMRAAIRALKEKRT